MSDYGVQETRIMVRRKPETIERMRGGHWLIRSFRHPGFHVWEPNSMTTEELERDYIDADEYEREQREKLEPEIESQHRNTLANALELFGVPDVPEASAYKVAEWLRNLK